MQVWNFSLLPGKLYIKFPAKAINLLKILVVQVVQVYSRGPSGSGVPRLPEAQWQLA